MRPLSAITIGASAFFLLFALLSLAVRPFGEEQSGPWTISNEAGERLRHSDIPVSVRLDNVATVNVTTEVGPTDGDALALIWPDATALTVYWNGREIHNLGFQDSPTANLWSSAFAIPLPDEATHGNELRLQMTSPYLVQMVRAPIIAPVGQVLARVALHNALYQGMLTLFMGASAAIGAILILLARLKRPVSLSGLLLGAAAILMALYAADYTLRTTTGTVVVYRWFRVISISAGYSAALLFTMSLERYFSDRFRLSWFVAVPTVVAIVLIVGSPSLAWLFRWLPLINSIMFVDLLVVLIVIARNLRTRVFMLIPFTIISLSLLELILVMILSAPWPPILQFTVLVAAGLFSAYIIADFTEVYRARDALKATYNRDALTGSYNRRLLEELDLSTFACAVVTDLDNFKSYNDTLGHAAGDKVLQLFAHILEVNVRDEDLVVRIGGDEFLVLLKDADFADTGRIMERIRAKFRAACGSGLLDVSYGAQPVDGVEPASFGRADGEMYAMKRAHKS